VCWSIVVKNKPTDGSQFFGAFPSDRIPKAAKDVSVIYLFTLAIPISYTSEFQELLEATVCITLWQQLI
jgi:hypothetical protein